MPISRRHFLQFLGAGAVTMGVCGVGAGVGAEPYARPPGALYEDQFLASCSRCMRCIDVCAPLALRPGHLLDGIKNIGTPIMDTSKCIVCMECIRFCPTGALSKIPKSEVDIGVVKLQQDVCLAWTKVKRCDACVKACPEKAIEMQRRRYPVVIEEKCNGCGICLRRCPQAGSLILVSEGAKRYPPQEGKIIRRLEDRVGPYEIEPDSYPIWLKNRLGTLAQHFGIKKG